MGQPLGPFDKVFLVKAEVSRAGKPKLNALTRFSLSNGPKLTRSPLSNWPILAHLTRSPLSNWPIGPFDKVSLVKWAKIGYSGLFDKVFLVKWPILAKSCFPGFRRFPEAWNTLLSRRRVRRVSMQDAGNLRRRSPAKVALGFACPVHPGKPTKPSAVADVRGSATGYICGCHGSWSMYGQRTTI